MDTPLSIINLRAKRSLLLDADLTFFQANRHEGKVIECMGYVSYTMLHGLETPETDSRICLTLTAIRLKHGTVRINGAFQQLLNISESQTVLQSGGSVERSRSVEGVNNLGERLVRVGERFSRVGNKLVRLKEVENRSVKRVTGVRKRENTPVRPSHVLSSEDSSDVNSSEDSSGSSS